MRLKFAIRVGAGACAAVIVAAALSCRDAATNPPTPSYTVTYDGNGNTGGSVPVDGRSYLAGEKVLVKSNSGKLVKTGLLFSFWSTKADGSGKSYGENDTFAIGPANVILYAIWVTPHIYYVIYNGNDNTGGTVPVDTNGYRNGDRVTAKQNSGGLVKTGFSFAGWNNTANGSGTDIPVDSLFTMPCTDMMLYAKWIAP